MSERRKRAVQVKPKAKRPTLGLLDFHVAKGNDGPAEVCAALNAVGGTYSQTSISLWLNAWRVPSGDPRTHIRLAYGVAEERWMQPVSLAQLRKVVADRKNGAT